MTACSGKEKASVFAAFAAYRDLKRRVLRVSGRGIDIPFFRARNGISGSTIHWGGREFINYSGYNYLGLSGHPAVSAAAKRAIDQYGTSASASRIVSGQIELHGELERRLATFLGTEDCLVFVSGYLTNVTVIAHLFGAADLVAYDDQAHNSIMTGAKLSGATLVAYEQGNWSDLDRQIEPIRATRRRGLLVTEGVYSMDGEILDLRGAVEAKARHNLLLMVDEAHSLGVLGNGGRGICEYAGVPRASIDINMGTLSKALASCGGYIAGSKELVEQLRFLAPGFIFSAGLSPPDTAAALAALDVIEREPERVAALRHNGQFFRHLARQYGLEITGANDAPIASLVVGGTEETLLLSQRLLAEAIYVQPIVYPAVEPTAGRLRFFITSNHTEAQMLKTVPIVAREFERCVSSVVG